MTLSSCSCVGVMCMEPSILRRAPARHGQSISTCSGVSASSPQTRQDAAGHFLFRHPAHTGEGKRPIRWRYWRETCSSDRPAADGHPLPLLCPPRRPASASGPPDPLEEGVRPSPAPGSDGGTGYSPDHRARVRGSLPGQFVRALVARYAAVGCSVTY